LDTDLKKTLRASEQDREDVKLKRDQWMRMLPSLDPQKLVFLDESGVKTNMTRLRGRAKNGLRLFAQAPHGHWCTTTLISSIRLNGETATLEIEGASDSIAFRTYIEQILSPSLKEGDVVVMDNLRSHYDLKAIEQIEHCGAQVLFLPPYSPDFNPIEKMWSKIKSFLRKLEARSQRELSYAITQAFKRVTPEDARGWFSSCFITVSQS